jgi:hypothetical protein
MCFNQASERPHADAWRFPPRAAESEVRAIDYWFQAGQSWRKAGCSRYKDYPWAAIKNWPAIFYVVLPEFADRDVGVGPSVFLQIFLAAAADRAVDRKRAAARSMSWLM